jgi:hypothetical protein
MAGRRDGGAVERANMANIGNGYGSECHLLRYLGRHRNLLDEAILARTGGRAIAWRDFSFDPATSLGDGEPKGLDFLPDGAVKDQWKLFWPQRGNQPNWDAVGILERGAAREWLLVEAKANVEELSSSCAAKEGEGRRRIVDALKLTKKGLDVPPDRDWLNGYYQLANRIAVLQFLISKGEPARLVLIYFVGDRNVAATCPGRAEQWSRPLARQEGHLGLSSDHHLSDRIHKVFLEANPSKRIRKRVSVRMARQSLARASGIVDSGIPDLASNPQHLADLGRKK